MNVAGMWKLTNVITGQVIYCETKPPMDNPFDGWESSLWSLEAPLDAPRPHLCATPDTEVQS